MAIKPENFNPSANYASLHDALEANKKWYTDVCQYFKQTFHEQMSQPDLTEIQKSHLFDHYQINLSNARNEYKINKTNIKNHFKAIKAKFVSTKQAKILSSMATRHSAFRNFLSIITNKSVIAGICFTVFLLVLFHAVSIITIPGISVPSSYSDKNSFAQMLNLLAGGGLTRMSIFAVGVGPYITSQIIVQLLSSDLVPPLSRLAKQGERGKRKLEVLTRALTLPFALIQAYAVMALILSFNNQSGSSDTFGIFGHTSIGDMSAGEIFSMMMILTGGTYMTIFMGDMITKRGVGNGITVIILAGILANLFGNFQSVFQHIASLISPTQSAFWLTVVLTCAIYMIFYLLVLLVITFFNNCIRKIPVQQTGQGLTTEVKNLPYLPIKFNAAGVIPVIFASSIMTIPSTIAQFLSEGEGKWVIQNYFTLESWLGVWIYFVLVILFTFFYSYVQINPSQLAENFEKSGKFIPGVKSGEDTERHITKVLNRINWLGGPFLAVVAILPYVVSLITKIPSGLAIGGTGIIIIVSAATEIWNSIKSAATNSGYTITKTKIQANYYDEQATNTDKVEELW